MGVIYVDGRNDALSTHLHVCPPGKAAHNVPFRHHLLRLLGQPFQREPNRIGQVDPIENAVL